MYKEDTEMLDSSSFGTQTDIEGVIANKIEPALSDKKTRNYYIEKFPKNFIDRFKCNLESSNIRNKFITGKFTNSKHQQIIVGSFTASR